MKDYEEKKLKKCLLMMADDIDELCTKHHINYSLDGGSLIGAVRHQGFIPWDDDFDIDMTREDYNKFVKVCNRYLNDKYFLQTYDTDQNYPMGHSKILLKGTVVIEEGTEKCKYQRGVFIDIFPWDNVPDNRLLEILQRTITYFIIKILHQKCNSGFPKGISGIKRCGYHFLKIISPFFSRKHLIIVLKKWLTLFPNSTENVACMVGKMGYKKTKMERAIFNDYIRVPFEDRSYYAVGKYDSMLKKIYGNYMLFPPQEERYSHNFSFIDFGDVRVE